MELFALLLFCVFVFVCGVIVGFGFGTEELQYKNYNNEYADFMNNIEYKKNHY